ncbi:MAG: hypothetical protein ACOC00_05710 [Halothiobacillaceae bacterium]
MARIRSIKPEFWTSAQILECSPNARLLFIGMWNFCDDAGRHPDSLKQLKAEIFPADEMTLAEVEKMLDELSANGLITRYLVDGKGFIQVDGWHHQKIDRPQPPKHPAPLDDDSSSVRRTFAPDRKGEDRKGEEGIGGEDGARQARAAPPAAQPEPSVETDDKPARPKRAKTLKPADLIADLPGLSAEVAQDYLDHRRAKGSRLTPTAWKQIAAEVARCPDTPNECLAEAMAAGWQGFRADWYANRKRGTSRNASADRAASSQSAVDDWLRSRGHALAGHGRVIDGEAEDQPRAVLAIAGGA